MARRVIPLSPPAGYMGGKRLFAGTICAWILARKPEKVFDLCCGSGAISIALVQRGFPAKNLTMVDLGPWGGFWKKLTEGTLDLPWIKDFLFTKWPRKGDTAVWLTEQAKALPPTPELFIILQASTYGSMPAFYEDGEWWRIRKGTHWLPRPANELTRSVRENLWSRLLLLSKRMKGVAGIQQDVSDSASPWFKAHPGTVVYIDPPYVETGGYGRDFDFQRFVGECPRPFFVSEQREIPGADRAIAIGTRRPTAVGGGRSRAVVEYLNIFE